MVAAAARRVEVLLHVDVHDYHAVVAMAKTILSRRARGALRARRGHG